MSGILYLIPVGLGNGDVLPWIAPETLAIARSLDRFVVENAKSARAFLKAIAHPLPIRSIAIDELNEHTPVGAIPGLLSPLKHGMSCGVLSEAGCPAVADPGAALVRAAHQAGVCVRPLVGPSSILLALMASGLNGQRFAFHGYLPAGAGDRAKRLRELEMVSLREDRTEIFIETPYRNLQTVETLLESCAPSTLLTIAAGLTTPSEMIETRSIAAWRKRGIPPISRVPAVFLLYARSHSAHCES